MTVHLLSSSLWFHIVRSMCNLVLLWLIQPVCRFVYLPCLNSITAAKNSTQILVHDLLFSIKFDLGGKSAIENCFTYCFILYSACSGIQPGQCHPRAVLLIGRGQPGLPLWWSWRCNKFGGDVSTSATISIWWAPMYPFDLLYVFCAPSMGSYFQNFICAGAALCSWIIFSL